MFALTLGLVSSATLPATTAVGDVANAARRRLDERLEWFQDLRFGLFIHWGIYSQWGCIESWPLVEEDAWARPDGLACWEERGRDMERFRRDYFALKSTFDPTAFDPALWAEEAKRAGMQYVVFTTKHHDGFSMFDTRQTDFRITAPGCPYSRSPQPDVVHSVFEAFRKQGFGIGAYFSKSDWHCPYYWWPGPPARTRNPNYDTHAEPQRWSRFVEFVRGQVEELMTDYGPVDILWLDGGQVRPPDQDIRMDRLAAMARSHQPDLIIVDRTVGGEYENYITPEQEVPEEPLTDVVWESCITMGTQWSYRPDDHYKSTHELIHLLVGIVAKGGNLLLNIGPGPDGRLPDVAVDRLRAIGAWMGVNAEAIHGTRPIAPYRSGDFAYTQKGGSVYATYLPPEGADELSRRLVLTGFTPPPGARVRLLGTTRDLAYEVAAEGVVVTVPEGVAASPPCRHAYVLRWSR